MLDHIGEVLSKAPAPDVKPGPLDPMGSYTGATDLQFSSNDLFSPQPLGTGNESFDPEAHQSTPRPNKFE